MSHLCIIHSPDGAPWADYTTSKLLNKFPQLKIASIPDDRAFSNCTRNDPSIPESDAVILIASPNLLDYLNVHSDVVFNGSIDKHVKHCLVLLLGLDKEDMDDKADHFSSYEKWTHLTLTEDQEDLVALFQRIIEIMQEVVNSRTKRPAAQQKPPVAKTKPKPPVRPKPTKQACVEISSGDELEESTRRVGAGEGHDGRQTTAAKSPGQTETVPGGEPESQSNKTVSSQESSDSLAINITPSTPHEEVAPETGTDADDSDYTRNIIFVKGSALLKAEQCHTISDNEDNIAADGLTLQPFAQKSVKRETDTDESIYINSQVKNSDFISKTGQSKATTATADLNGNLVTQPVMSTSATDSPAEDFDDIDGPSSSLWTQEVPPSGHRPRSGRISDKEVKRFRNKSAALRFTLSPPVVNGDDEREVILVFERALRGDTELEVMLAGVPDHPPRTLHSVNANPYNIKVIVPKLQAGRVQLRLMKKDVTCGVQHLDVISTNCDMIGLSQLYLTTLNLVCTSQRAGSPKRQLSTESADSQDGSPRVALDKHIIHLFENNDIPVAAFEKVFGIYEEFVERDETMNGDLPTMLHFSARYGLCELTSRLIDLPGAREVCNLKNHNGYKPVDLARLYNHHELADFLDQYSKTIDTREEIYAQMRDFFERRESRKSKDAKDAPKIRARKKSYDGTIRRSAAFKCRKNSNPSLAISVEYKRKDSTESLARSQSRKGSGTSSESVFILMKSSLDSDTRESDNEANSREGSQPPVLAEEEEAYIVPDELKSETAEESARKAKIQAGKPRKRLDKIVPPPPAPCTGRGTGYVNAPDEGADGYVNAPSNKTCPYDNTQPTAGSGWDEQVPAGPGVSRLDSYLAPVSPDGENYERMISEDMVECDLIRAKRDEMFRRSYSDEEQYISMHSRTSGDYMSMGGVHASEDYTVMGDVEAIRRRHSGDDYMNMENDQPIEPEGDEGYLKLTEESKEPDLTIPTEYLTVKEPSWDDEVPLSPAFMMKEIRGEEPLASPPAACAPLPGYMAMGGKEEGDKKNSYVNEEVFSQQRNDRVEAYATSASSEQSVPPPPFHENSFSGKEFQPSTIQHGPMIGQVTADMFKSKSQKELLEILHMVKSKEINMHEAELMFSAWQQQYNGGMTQSFRDKRDQLKMMQNEFDMARQNFGSTEKLNTGKKPGFFTKFFKNPRKKSGDSTGDPDQPRRLTKSTGSESSLTDSVDGSSLDTVSTQSVHSRALQAVKEVESSRLSTVSNSSSSSNGSRISCGSISSTHDSGIDELPEESYSTSKIKPRCNYVNIDPHSDYIPMYGCVRKNSRKVRAKHQQERNSAHLAEEVVKSDVYPKPPPVPTRNTSQRRPLPPVPGASSTTSTERPVSRRRAIPTAVAKKGPTTSRIPAMQSNIPNKSKSQEALDTASASSNDELSSSSCDANKPQTLPKPKRKPGYEQVVLGLANNRMFRERKQSQSKEEGPLSIKK